MTEAGYATMAELARVQNEYEASIYNDLVDIVHHKSVRVVHIIKFPKDYLFSVDTGPEYLKIETAWYMIDDSYSKKDGLLHLVSRSNELVGEEVLEALRRNLSTRIRA